MSSPQLTAARAPVYRRWLTAFGVALLLGLHAWMAISAMRDKSTTVDEMAHLTAGHALWAKGDYRLQPENGNLPQRWEGLPAWLKGRSLPPRENPGWQQPNVWTLGQAYFHDSGNDLGALLFDGRAMNVIWSVATGLLVFVWACSLWGPVGGWVALGFFTFSPTMLAHAALATSDMCMAFFMLASVGAYWRHLRNPNSASLALSCLTLGLAFVAKYSAVLLLPTLTLLAAVRLFDHAPFGWRRDASTRSDRARIIGLSAVAHLGAVWLIIWAFHGFRFSPVTDPTLPADYTRHWSEVLASVGQPLSGLLSWARETHFLPDAYLYGFGFVVDLSHLRGAFLNGATSLTGWVSFFPYAFFAKTTIALLIGTVAVAGLVALRWRRRGRATVKKDLYQVAPLAVLLAVYWAASLASHLNIGQRHLLPTYPILFIAMGALGWQLTQARAFSATAAIALLLSVQIAESFFIRPDYLAFFNALVGGPRAGYRHLVDSSLDWGQDLPGLAHWLNQNNAAGSGTPVYLAYFGNGDPAYYGINAVTMVPLLRIPAHPQWYRLEPGIYCISATMLSQAYSSVRGPWTLAREKEYQDLRQTLPALLDYAAHPERRSALEAEIPAGKWKHMWDRFEQLQFARLATYLRARTPDAQIGYSINIYRVTTVQLDQVLRGNLASWRQAIEQASTNRSP